MQQRGLKGIGKREREGEKQRHTTHIQLGQEQELMKCCQTQSINHARFTE